MSATVTDMTEPMTLLMGEWGADYREEYVSYRHGCHMRYYDITEDRATWPYRTGDVSAQELEAAYQAALRDDIHTKAEAA